jgi:hypothetical protein
VNGVGFARLPVQKRHPRSADHQIERSGLVNPWAPSSKRLQMLIENQHARIETSSPFDLARRFSRGKSLCPAPFGAEPLKQKNGEDFDPPRSTSRGSNRPTSEDWLPPLKSTVSFLRQIAGRSKESGVSVFRRRLHDAVRPDNDCLCGSRLSRHCRYSKLTTDA